MLADFKPSDVLIELHFFPLPDTFERAENEIAAALAVRALTTRGNTWRAVSLPEMSATFREDVAAKREPFYSLTRNPFAPRPDVDALVKGGWLRWTGPPRVSTLEFTSPGIERLRRWAWCLEQREGWLDCGCVGFTGDRTRVFVTEPCGTHERGLALSGTPDEFDGLHYYDGAGDA